MMMQPAVTLKFLLAGDANVGKQEILDRFSSGGLLPSTSNELVHQLPHKMTTILLDGQPVRLHLWDTSGHYRHVIQNHSRGGHGVLLVFDITSKWSFEGIKRWMREIDDTTPGLPRVLIGNRLHLEFRRAIPRKEVEHFARKRNMEYFEVSTLADFNVAESLVELARLVLNRHVVRPRLHQVPSLQMLCCREVGRHLQNVHCVDKLPLHSQLQNQVRSFAAGSRVAQASLSNLNASLRVAKKRRQSLARRISHELRGKECSIM